MKFALFDAGGFPTAFYAPEIHGENIPADAIEITESQWLEFINNQGRRLFVDGEVVAYEPPPIPVLIVTAAQAVVALERRSLLDQVEAAVATYPRDVQLWYQRARDWERYNTYVMGIAIELGMTDAQVDELFTHAATLSA